MLITLHKLTANKICSFHIKTIASNVVVTTLCEAQSEHVINPQNQFFIVHPKVACNLGSSHLSNVSALKKYGSKMGDYNWCWHCIVKNNLVHAIKRITLHTKYLPCIHCNFSTIFFSL